MLCARRGATVAQRKRARVKAAPIGDVWPADPVTILAARHYQQERPTLWDSGQAGSKVTGEYERQLGRPRINWTEEDWRVVALDLAARLEEEHKANSAGAPATRRSNIALVSYLAHQRIDEFARAGERLTLRNAISQVYREWFTHQREIEPQLLDTLCREERALRSSKRK